MKAKIQVFLSYAHADSAMVGKIYDKLLDTGVKPWMDTKDILPGEVWELAIRNAIRNSDFFLACLTPRSVNKRGVIQSEIKDALDVWRRMLEDDIYLIPMRLELCDMPEALGDFQRVDFYEDNGWTRLMEAVRVGLERRLEQALGKVLETQSLKEFADTINSSNLGMYAQVELLAELNVALKYFDQASLHVSSYLELQNIYRKREALDSALEKLEALKDTLAVMLNQFNPLLLQVKKVTNKWFNLLDSELMLQTKFKVTREIPNPFIFANPIAEHDNNNIFTGRGDVLRQVESLILNTLQPPAILLHGSRRMGKTSILNQLPRLLGPDFASAMVDCQNPAVTESRTTMLRYLSRACSEGLRRRHIQMEPLSAAKLEREPFAALDKWLDGVERAMPEGMRALLCLDDYERLQATLEAGWGGAFLDALRHTLQHRPRVVLMFTGAHTFQELGPEWTDRFISARRVRVSFLGREDVELLLTRPIPEFDMKYAPGALDAVVAATSCQPFLAQAVAFELVQYLNEQQRKEATPADVEEAIRRALVSGGEYFANVWSDAGAEGQAILRALAAGERPPDFHAARAWLREHDVLDGEGRFAVEMMRRWVKGRA